MKTTVTYHVLLDDLHKLSLRFYLQQKSKGVKHGDPFRLNKKGQLIV